MILHPPVGLMLETVLQVEMMVTMATAEPPLRVVCVVRSPSVRWMVSDSCSEW